MGAPYAGQFLTPGRFAGRVAVVTGAAQGIGQKVAELIGAEGGAVVLEREVDEAAQRQVYALLQILQPRVDDTP